MACNVPRNKLKDLPNMPCNLVDLQYLDCSHNSILILPEEFFKFCSKLETFIGVNNGLGISCSYISSLFKLMYAFFKVC